MCIDLLKIHSCLDAGTVLYECLKSTKANKKILVVDNLHLLMDPDARSPNSLNMLAILNWFLKNNKIQCIGISTLSTIRPYFKEKIEFLQNFQPVLVSPATSDETVRVLQVLKDNLQAHHGVHISDDAIRSAVAKSESTSIRSLPEKAVLVLDEACALVKLRTQSLGLRNINAISLDISDLNCPDENESSRLTLERLTKELEEATTQNTVTSNDIETVISDWT